MRWINVDNVLPQDHVIVLVYNPKDGVNIGEFNEEKSMELDKGWTTYYDWDACMPPTHWLPLPEAPK